MNQDFLRSKFLSVGLAIVVGALTLSMLDIRAQKFQVRQQAQDLEGKIASLEQENSYLQRFGDYFKSFAFLEKEARKQLNYKAPGEEVVFVYKDTLNKASRSQDFEERLKGMANWEKWLYYILGK